MVNAVPDPIILPDIFNDDNNVDAPETTKLLKLVLLLINNIEFVDKLVKLVFNVDIDVLVLFIKFNNDVDVVFKLVIDVDKLFKFVFVAYIDKSGLFVIEL